jgi:hypothetical protein
MVSITTVLRSGYYVLRMLPSLIWLPINIRTSLRHTMTIFEEQLVQSGLDRDIARRLAEAYHEANKDLVGQFTSLKAWK